MNAYFDCNDCPNISITEQQQTRVKESHICKRTGKKLFHRGQHPMIPPPKDCPFSEFYEKAGDH